jgi:hypothetical protein
MGLLTTDIRKERRLSLKDVKLPAPDRKPINVETPSTAEERMYSKIVEKYPLFLEAVELLDLVSPVTGTRVKIVDTKPSRETLIALAKRLIKGEAIHSKEEIIEAIKTGSKVSQERAEKGFSLMLEAGAFEPIGDSYYLTGSTPF